MRKRDFDAEAFVVKQVESGEITLPSQKGPGPSLSGLVESVSKVEVRNINGHACASAGNCSNQSAAET